MTREEFDRLRDQYGEHSDFAIYTMATGKSAWGVKLIELIPQPDRRQLLDFIVDGCPLMNAFLYAILTGDLFKALDEADQTQMDRFTDYPKFLINYAPPGLVGSVDRIEEWCRQGGIIGGAARNVAKP